jgi:putative ABC transport system permease protein
VNDVLVVPLPTLTGRSLDVSPEQPVDEVWLQTDNGDRVAEVGVVLGQALLKMHRGRWDVDVVIPRELLAQRYRTQQTFSVVIGSIAAIALLIGGIGIMNIMLTSVVERTHEIGILRTVGATRTDVTIQFLTESLLMTFAGGVLGIVIGVASALGITAYAGWATYVSAPAVALGIVVSLSVGLVFGIYPAVKAAKLEPVDALRYE